MGVGFLLFFPLATLKSIGSALIILGLAFHLGVHKFSATRQTKAEQG